MFSFPIIGFSFSVLYWPGLLNFYFQVVIQLFIEVGIAESNTEGCLDSILLSFMVPEYPVTFQKLFIKLKRFFAKLLVPVGLQNLYDKW